MIRQLRFEAPAWNLREIARYARADINDERIAALIDECIEEAEAVLDYRVCYTTDEIVREDGMLQFCGIRSDSATIAKAVNGCEHVVLFASTVGAPFDRLIAKYSRLEPSKALILQAIGAERVESLCDAFCEKLNMELNSVGKSLRTRVSPGYGDIPLSIQIDIFKVLDCERKIGLTLNESLLMSPSKSVTAIMGIGAYQCRERVKCADCDKADCIYRQ